MQRLRNESASCPFGIESISLDARLNTRRQKHGDRPNPPFAPTTIVHTTSETFSARTYGLVAAPVTDEPSDALKRPSGLTRLRVIMIRFMAWEGAISRLLDNHCIRL